MLTFCPENGDHFSVNAYRGPDEEDPIIGPMTLKITVRQTNRLA